MVKLVATTITIIIIIVINLPIPVILVYVNYFDIEPFAKWYVMAGYNLIWWLSGAGIGFLMRGLN